MKVGVIFAVVFLGSVAPTAAQTDEDAGVKACEASIIGALRSPASYSRFKVDDVPGGIEIIYDAANGFGALLREKTRCIFVQSDVGLRLASEPLVAASLGSDACRAEVERWIAAGNITERAAIPFFDDCNARLQSAQSQFMQSFKDLDVSYPVPPDQTVIQALE